MNRVIVSYQVKPEHAARNEELVREVYEELDREQPEGLRYATFKLDDGVTFIHIASNESGEQTSPLVGIAAFKRFQEGLPERAEQPSTRSQLIEIGSFRFFES